MKEFEVYDYEQDVNRSKITKELVDAIAEEISRGVPIRYACYLNNISPESYYSWKRQGEKEPDDSESLFKYAFLKDKEAKALSIASRIDRIRLDPSWQSDAWWLERMAPDDFGKKQTIDANVKANVKSDDISKLFNDPKVDKILEEESNSDSTDGSE